MSFAGPYVRADQTTVRRANLGVVLRKVAERTTCSRADVATETGLTRGTVSSLVGELIDLGLLIETGESATPRRVGRPGVGLRLGDRVVAIGLEINVDHLAVSAEDLEGRVVIERVNRRDNRGARPAAVLDRLAGLATAVLDELRAESYDPVGIGVAVPGLVSLGSDVLLHAPNLGWSDLDIATELRARLGDELPVRVDNEANLAALAEHWYGAGRGLRSFICVYADVGVGAGIFVDGELFRGSHGYGGELGHVTVDPQGLPCACGSRGCLETFVGQDAIARRAGLPTPTEGLTRHVTDDLVRRAEAGDRATLESLRDAGRVLGTALASTINVFDLDAIVLGGAYGPLAPWLVDEVRAALADHLLFADWSTCEVRTATFGEGAAVRGAAAMVIRGALASPWIVAGRAARSQELVS